MKFFVYQIILRGLLLISIFFCNNLKAQSNNVPGEIGVNNAQIFYYHHGHEIPKNIESTMFVKPYVGYVDQDGITQDYLMDSFLLYDVEFYKHYFNEDSSTFLNKYLDNTFSKARMISLSTASFDIDGSNSAYISKNSLTPRNGIAQKYIEIKETDVEYSLSCFSKVDGNIDYFFRV